MTVALRAHHLLCLLTYAGTGYSPAFVDNFNRVVGRLGAGEGAALVTGPDALCAPLCACEGDRAHCHDAGVTVRDQCAARDVSALLGIPLADGVRVQVDAPLVARLRAAFAQGGIRTACGACPWADLCTGIAAKGFAGVHLYPPA